jgi:predicted GIY-YIG superfamily endonuclease
MFYVYVLKSEWDAGFYIGYSNNLRMRIGSTSEWKESRHFSPRAVEANLL